MEAKVKISVIIPVYNLDRYVSACLDSVLAAARSANVDLEVICVDDGSTDGSGAILDGYASGDRRIHVVHRPNSGAGSARNAGMDVATGDWLTFVDGDDIWLANYLSTAEALIRRHPSSDIVSLACEPFEDRADAPEPSGSAAREAVFDVCACVPHALLRDVGVFPTLFRRDFVGAERFAGLVLGEDRLFVVSCLVRASSVVRSETVVHGYRLRADSAMRSSWRPEKTMSLVDYSFGSIQRLATCGKWVETGAFTSFLSGVLLAEAPKNCSLFSPAYRAVWSRWRKAVAEVDTRLMPSRHSFARRLILYASHFRVLSLLVARILRRLGVTR